MEPEFKIESKKSNCTHKKQKKVNNRWIEGVMKNIKQWFRSSLIKTAGKWNRVDESLIDQSERIFLVGGWNKLKQKEQILAYKRPKDQFLLSSYTPLTIYSPFFTQRHPPPPRRNVGAPIIRVLFVVHAGYLS